MKANQNNIKTYSHFLDFMRNLAEPVILLEGKRKITDDYSAKAMKLGELFAHDLSHAFFRSGNAEGSDHYFTEGVRRVRGNSLQIFAPYRGHRKKYAIEAARYIVPEDLSNEAMQNIIETTVTASPKYRGLMKQLGQKNGAGARARYLLRDTLKVVGSSKVLNEEEDSHLSPVTVAFFFADLSDLDSGGTGHTIRVCRHLGVPYFLQDTWGNWVQG